MLTDDRTVAETAVVSVTVQTWQLRESVSNGGGRGSLLFGNPVEMAGAGGTMWEIGEVVPA